MEEENGPVRAACGGRMEVRMETGSFYEINPDFCRSMPAGEMPEPALKGVKKYGKARVRYTASGREAIALALRGLKKERPGLPRISLLPAYMCDSVFFPFVRGGWKIIFYHVNRSLEPDEEELRRLVEKLHPGLIFVHAYYGVDTAASIRPFLRACREEGICIMEDVTQSLYLKGIGAEADYVVGSLRKWYAVPEGGFVAADSLPEERLPLDGAFTARRMELQIRKWEYLQGGRTPEEQSALKEDFLRKNRETEAWLDAYEGVRALSSQAAYLLGRVDEEACRKQRQDNYAFLYERLKKAKRVVPILERKEDAAPLYLAVYTDRREELQRFLAGEAVYAPVLWPVGKENQAWLTEEERYIYEHMLALPIDQRYGRAEMERVAEVLERYERQEAGRVVGIRADANDTVATGHIMRCITIARELIRAGSRVIFFTADGGADGLLDGAGMTHVCLHTDWRHMEEELPALRRLLREQGCTRLLVDSYRMTRAYLEGLRDLCRIACMDDCFEDVWPADLVINYNAYHVRFPYEKAYAKGTVLLLGTAYVPLREEFGRKGGWEPKASHAEAEILSARPAAFHVLLSSGGGDRCHALTGILSALFEPAGGRDREPAQGAEETTPEGWEHVIFHTVMGSFHEDRQELEKLAGRHPNIRLYHGVSNMAELMEKCDAAVSAAGTMLFELSAMKVPTVFFVSADNQQYDREFFGEGERMLFAGDLRRDRQDCLDRILAGLQRLRRDGDLRGRMKVALSKVTDGLGAGRIAEAILRLPDGV